MPGERIKSIGSLQRPHRPNRVLHELADRGGGFVPPPPPNAIDGSPLRREAQDAWKRYWASPVSAAFDIDADYEALATWARATSQRYETSEAIVAEPLVPGSKGQPVLNPLVTVEKELTRVIERAEEQFGMTPKARFRLLGNAVPAESGLLDQLNAELDAAAGMVEPIPKEYLDDPK